MSSNASTTPSQATVSKPAKPKSQQRPRRPNYNHIHRNLLPLEVYPLPVLIPHNPLSLIAIALSYLTQILAPPSRPTYNGYFSSATSSIHVTDPDTIRKLWEMGFFGRGSLSRSEPTWFQNQKKKGMTAEENTAKRRIERRQQKLERARKEQEDIESRLSEEAKGLNLDDKVLNGYANGHADSRSNGHLNGHLNGHTKGHPNGHVQGEILKTNSGDLVDIASVLESANEKDMSEQVEQNNVDSKLDSGEWQNSIEVNGIPTPPLTSTPSETSLAETRPVKQLQRTKTVRFSPTIEAREFDLTSPVISPIKSPGSSPIVESETIETTITQDQEHLNLSLEETFFLTYGLGVLQVFCDDSDATLPASSLLSLFRRHSYHPPRSLSVPAEPDDSFMLSYTAYHHYRSLGWVVRSGVKFGVDYLLYNRGPAFAHADFAVIILPSYTHDYWSDTSERQDYVRKKTHKTWWWLHGLNRVQAQVQKQLVLCYVNVPPPLSKEDQKGGDIDIGRLFQRYKIRDICVKRWTPNRSRD